MKLLLLTILLIASISCKKDNNTVAPPPPDPQPPIYRTVIKCLEFKRDTIYTRSGYMIPRWLCTKKQIDTIR